MPTQMPGDIKVYKAASPTAWKPVISSASGIGVAGSIVVDGSTFAKNKNKHCSNIKFYFKEAPPSTGLCSGWNYSYCDAHHTTSYQQGKKTATTHLLLS